MRRLNRQSFLGPTSDAVLAGATIGIVGLGGGGSHIAQQAGHAGIGGFVLVDPQEIDNTNTNRLVGSTLADVDACTTKTAIAARTIRSINPDARILKIQKSWQDATDTLKACDIIIGAVDSFREREQLERFARRYLIPYIDIGMDVHDLGEKAFLISGQVILSTPGNPCLRCCGVITDERLQREAERYGTAGGNPQVVWPNGVLASTASGLAVKILVPWHRFVPAFAYLEYDGNKGTVTVSNRVAIIDEKPCKHHPADETGDPTFDIRAHLKSLASREAVVPEAGWWNRLWRRCLSR